jgi:hypothetical protein
MFNQPENVLKVIPAGASVLDVGGGVAPFRRADAVVDIEPLEAHRGRTRGRTDEFAGERWYVGDICDPQVWSQIPDKAFDFVVCSHTLEDVRDPLFVCGQLQRVARAGYIETPSKFRECAKADGSDVVAGWEHHRWIVQVENGTLFFTLKNPFIHHFDYLGDARRARVFDWYNQFLGVHWVGSFDYAERSHKGSPIDTEDLHFFYDHYPFNSVCSADCPPVFHTIENSPFKGKTFYLGHEYRLPVEEAYSPEEIVKRHQERLAGERTVPRTSHE